MSTELIIQETLNGIAPGAKVISLKIGNCTLAFGATTSGSMKKALDYEVNYAKEHNVPVVFNFSYGIGSELEGRSDIDQLMVRDALITAKIRSTSIILEVVRTSVK